MFAILALVILAGLLLDAQFNAAIAQGYGELAPVLAIHPD